MAVQQVKKSKQKSKQRRASKRYQGVGTSTCSHCGSEKLPHRVCHQCGYYANRQVLTVTSE